MSSLVHNRETSTESSTGTNSSNSSTYTSSSSNSSGRTRVTTPRNRNNNSNSSMGLKNFIAKNINLLILVTIISLSIYTLLSLITPSSLIWVFALIAVAGTFLQIWYGFRYTTRIIEVNGQYHIYPANASNLLFNNNNNNSSSSSTNPTSQNRMFLSNSRFSHLINPPLNLQLTFIDRDFDSNDYDMLLALDDDNQNYGGAKKEQIDLLPLHSLSSKKDLESLFNSGCMDFCKTEIKETKKDEADTSSSGSKVDNIDDSSSSSNLNNSQQQKDCSICLEGFKIGDSIRTLPCVHHYHRECIDQWLKIKSVCPVCKLDVF
ncbi:hypothetical protein CYY_005640 [Polysphondylium violaceum]|uniref:RING-type domain-containing protein n=1 Tax=Polysphondylium violaceum TaxID=133409 RepID=A0A8J4PT71_9MYCE|nr:hypothetical protein CYY_005640 [Polysphondylium violaceum]